MTELGSRLRMAREEKSLTLDELQNITRIQKRYLVAIEEGKYEILPGKFYARAFIKQYAEAVGLEPEILFDEYRNEIPLTNENDIPERLSRIQNRKAVSPTTSKFMELFPKILTAVFVIAVIFLIYTLVMKYVDFGEKPTDDNNKTVDITESDDVVPENNEDTNTDNSNDNSDGNTDESDDTQGENPDNVNDEGSDSELDDPDNEEQIVEQELTLENVNGYVSTFRLTNTDKFEFEIKASDSGRSWISVKNGQNTMFFQGEIKDGESKTFDFTEEDSAYIVVGRTLDTEILINGEPIEFQSEPVRQDIQINFTKQD
ncbi:MAG TPA: RodZ family helix-turn-helix domain-containing protein [Bacillaceae bacterium]|nr:RodZ family helix-turn-helix domain-containing protein [Bacillaceae bacterium]